MHTPNFTSIITTCAMRIPTLLKRCDMLRQIVVPKDNRLLLQLPDDYINQRIEVIAFPIDDDIKKKPTESDPLAIFEQYSGSFDGKINRDELYDR